MINHTNIEDVIGTKTLVTDAMQHAIEGWYRAAIEGEPLDGSPETLSLGLPALICSELARMTTLEVEVSVTGSERADWIQHQLQQVLSPRRRRKLALALALGSGIWKPFQASSSELGVSFIPATGYYPVSNDTDGNLTEAVFVDTIVDSNNYYNRLEWQHALNSKDDLRSAEYKLLEDLGVDPPQQFPCVQVINLVYRSATADSLGSKEDPAVRPEWDGVAPVAYLPRLKKLPLGYFVAPAVNTIDPSSELGVAMFEAARGAIIDADQQYTRLDWEYEGGEMAVDVDSNYLKPAAAGQQMSRAEALRTYGVPPAALDRTAPHHRERLFHGIDVNTGITQTAPFYQIYAPGLRDNSYLAGLQQYLRNVEAHAGLSFGVISMPMATDRTATEIMSSKQKMYATVSDCQAALEDAMSGLVDALDYWANRIRDLPSKGPVHTAFKWDDSIIMDRLTEMGVWQKEIEMGLRSKQEYREHFFGEDEAVAAKAISSIQTELASVGVLRGVLDGGQ